jgi:NTP pyrophosphatase (non-canonical NTP hydrolase)
MTGMDDVLKQLRVKGTERNRDWHGDSPDVGAIYQAVELGGEVGEALNVVKKLEREARGMVGSRATTQQLADELADVIICTDNLAARFGIDLGDAVVRKFNATSLKNGFPQMMLNPADVSVPPLVDGQPMADMAFMQLWSMAVMGGRAPDFVIGANYLRRWWVIPRNPFANVYLHEICRSDDDRALHDHPWDNISVLISGGYREHLPDGVVIDRRAGDVVQRKASDLHRLELIDDVPAVSLFITGPKVRDWGFECPNGWVPWQIFTGFAQTGDSSQTGPGCGE